MKLSTNKATAAIECTGQTIGKNTSAQFARYIAVKLNLPTPGITIL